VSAAPKTGTKRDRSEDGRGDDASAAPRRSKTACDEVVKEKVTRVLTELKGTPDEEDGITVAKIAERCGDDVTYDQVRWVLKRDCGDDGAFVETTGSIRGRWWRLRRDGEVNAALNTGTKRDRSEDGRGDDVRTAPRRSKTACDEVKKKVTDILSKLKGTTNDEISMTVAQIAKRCGRDVTRDQVRYVLKRDCGDDGAFVETNSLIQGRRWRLRRFGEVSAAPKTGTKRDRSEDGRGDDASAAPKTGTKRDRSEDGRGDDASAASGKQKRKL
jgi:antitoxin component of RelBE/YafQ-DinJ toxin-antitoxin module